ncbi:helix-turn-helix transcriptional regulator [Paenibacillus kobensis]|uniref:helix-turn-helix transcriptional regulator n=1 Tax=Paenibacillus kobensis TaxID=59841 RepID=UPI0013E309B5|nr:AraC family transcriptional regulator [Paenibacillus kobensis]
MPRILDHPVQSAQPFAANLAEPLDYFYRNTKHYPIAQFHSHSFYELYYFHGGQCSYIIGDKLWSLAPGDLILLNGMTLHCPNPSPEVPYVRSIMHFDPGYIHRLLPDDAAMLLRPFGNTRLTLDETEQEEAERLLASMNELTEGQEPFALKRLALRFAELLYAVAGWRAKPKRQQLPPASDRERHVQHVITYVEERFAEQLTLDQIAGALHLTKPYLSNLFKEVTGTTIFKYIYNRRINQAKMMLHLDPSLPVAEVAHKVGFVHPAHFSRMFKESIGCTADAYRAQMKERLVK